MKKTYTLKAGAVVVNGKLLNEGDSFTADLEPEVEQRLYHQGIIDNPKQKKTKGSK